MMDFYYDSRGVRHEVSPLLFRNLHPDDVAMLQTPPATTRRRAAMIHGTTVDQENAYELRLAMANIPTVRRAPRLEGFKDGYSDAQALGGMEPTREQLKEYQQKRLNRLHYSLMEANSAVSGYQDGWQAWQDCAADND